MALNGLVAKLSVIMSFADNSSRQVLAALDERGNISINDSTDHDDSMLHISEDTNAVSTLAAQLTPSELTSLSAAVSGRYADDSNTQGDFALQYLDISGSSEWRSVGGDIQNFINAIEDTTGRARLVELFETAGLTLSIS